MSASDESVRPPVAGDDTRAADAEQDATQQAGETKDAPAGEQRRPARVGYKRPAEREQPEVPASPPSSGVNYVGPAKSKGASGAKPATAAGARRARSSGAGPAAKPSAAAKQPGAPPKATKPGASKPAPGARKPSATGAGKPPAPAARKRQAPPKSPRGGRTEKPPAGTTEKPLAGAREKPAAGTGEKPAAGTGKKPPARAAQAPRAAAARKPRADSAKTSPADAAETPRATASKPAPRAARTSPSASTPKSPAQAKPSAPTADKVAPVPPPPAPGEGVEPPTPTPTPPKPKAAPAPKPAPKSPPAAPDAAGAPPAGEPDAVDEPAAREPSPSGDAPGPARVADAALAYRLLTQRLRSRASSRRTHRSARPRPVIHGRIVPPDRRAELAAAAAAIAARDAGPGPAALKPAEGTRVRLVALGVIVVLAGAMLSIFLSRSPASALSTADARFMTAQLLAADGRVRSELATLDRRDVQRARSRTRAAVATARSLAVEIRAKNGDAAGRLRRALQRERDWLDAVGSTLANPRSPLRDEILDRDRRLIAALAALPGDGVARRDASQQLVAYALSRALPSTTG